MKNINTPDHVHFQKGYYSYLDNNAYPFIVANNIVFIGDERGTHNEMKSILKYELELPDEEINYQLFGRIWIWVNENRTNLISIWPGNRFNLFVTGEDRFSIRAFDAKSDEEGLKNNIDNNKLYLIQKVLQKAQLPTTNTYLSLGYANILVSDLIDEKQSINLNDNEINALNQQQQQMHLMTPEEKWKKMQDFRNTRDEKWAKKLGSMPMAQYNALRYVDESKKISKKKLINIISENIKKYIK